MAGREGEKVAAICHTRKPYRAGRKLTAVKAYTVAQESRYLIVRNVPALGCVEDLIKLFALYGPIDEYRTLDEEDCPPFTDVVWIKFCFVANARFAKRKMDDAPFMGAQLDVAYGLEYETVSDTRQKLEERLRTVSRKLAEAPFADQGAASKAGGTGTAPPSAPKVIADTSGFLPVPPPRPPRMPPHAFGGPMRGRCLPAQEVDNRVSSPGNVTAGALDSDRVVEAALTADIAFEAPSMSRVVLDIRNKLSSVSSGGNAAPGVHPLALLVPAAAASSTATVLSGVPASTAAYDALATQEEPKQVLKRARRDDGRRRI